MFFKVLNLNEGLILLIPVQASLKGMVRKASVKRIAKERMMILFERAIEIHEKEPELAIRYVQIARRICMKMRVRLPREYRRLLCRGCKQFVHPGCTLRVRVKSKGQPHITYTCLRCGHITRIPIKKDGLKKSSSAE